MQFPLLVLSHIQDLTLGGSSTDEAAAASEALAATGEVVTRDVSIFELLLSGGWYIMLPLAIMSFIAIFIFSWRLTLVTLALTPARYHHSTAQHHHGSITAPSLFYHCTTTAPSLHHHPLPVSPRFTSPAR